MSLLVQDLIALARIQHWSFVDIALGDGAALLFIRQRLRSHLGAHAGAVEGLVGASLQYNLSTLGSGVLVALDGTGTPVYATTTQDGWAVHLDVDGVPYIDPTETPVARDPFGQTGGTPGFPLPADFIRLIAVAGVYGPVGRVIPVDVIEERSRHTWAPGRNPAVFVSGNRLVPLMPFATGNTQDRWLSVTAIQISYIAVPVLTALTDAINYPSVLCEALAADLASLFGRQSQQCDKSDKAQIDREAARCASLVAAAADEILGAITSSSVQYKR
jgi:hypothetical protein